MPAQKAVHHPPGRRRDIGLDLLVGVVRQVEAAQVGLLVDDVEDEEPGVELAGDPQGVAEGVLGDRGEVRREEDALERFHDLNPFLSEVMSVRATSGPSADETVHDGGQGQHADDDPQRDPLDEGTGADLAQHRPAQAAADQEQGDDQPLLGDPRQLVPDDAACTGEGSCAGRPRS